MVSSLFGAVPPSALPGVLERVAALADTGRVYPLEFRDVASLGGARRALPGGCARLDPPPPTPHPEVPGATAGSRAKTCIRLRHFADTSWCAGRS